MLRAVGWQGFLDAWVLVRFSCGSFCLLLSQFVFPFFFFLLLFCVSLLLCLLNDLMQVKVRVQESGALGLRLGFRI